ncbi:hypothetical protein SAMN05444266_102410 [Chitinophaga jiangningensis]|uniref:Uncharacterized protein n=1 Tax=Chitinophaga jiangningensis TaxID=1419482 RepID=A0A1M6YNK0_9BACT|nr:hypothetical protein [Chitinophaga jiangningensis]SHL19904.1 hypothetical protein SAMN05444266_102410 [Chitinophaga jiangningensis]
MDTQKLLYIVLALGAGYMIYSTAKDLIKKKPSKEPAEPASSNNNNSNSSTILPLQLQAYERMALYVERISPQSLIGRIYQQGMTTVDMQLAMVQQIKAEYDHNVTQQIYVSAQTWDAIKTLKEQTISVINQVAASLPADAPAMELNKQILEVFAEAGASPSELVAQIINTEAKKLMK